MNSSLGEQSAIVRLINANNELKKNKGPFRPFELKER